MIIIPARIYFDKVDEKMCENFVNWNNPSYFWPLHKLEPGIRPNLEKKSTNSFYINYDLCLAKREFRYSTQGKWK